MGSEAFCTVRYGGQASEGKALLETSEVVFRGEFRLRVAFNEVTSVAVEDGELHLGFAGDVAVFELGRDAAKWAEKIRSPRSLLDKLGIKPDMRVVVLGVDDELFLSDLTARFGPPDRSLDAGEADVVFYGADRLSSLERLGALRSAIKSTGAVWVVSPKGKEMLRLPVDERVRDVDVMDAAREVGLVDNKVVSFSDTHTALRLVVPRSMR